MQALRAIENPPARLLPGVLALVREVERADGHEVLESHRFIDLANADAESLHGVAVVAGEDVVGYAHLRRHRRHGVELELLVAPRWRDDARDLVAALVDSATRQLNPVETKELYAWVPTRSAEVIAALESIGFRADRAVRQLRRPLPLPQDHPGRASHCPPLRTFRPGSDETEWLEVNNRAFAWHPDQGDWDLATLLAREHEPWFDASGFLVAEIDGHLAGFCWTKVHHRAGGESFGEIFVIATDPRRAPRGLGRCLLAAGLDTLASRGLATACLYVERTNARAIRLYEWFGFELDHEDVRLVRHLDAGTANP